MVDRIRIFLSWCHRDAVLKTALLEELLPALRFTDLTVEWWEDSHLTCGEEFLPSILDRLDQADFGLLLLSPKYFASSFIRERELPRFVGPGADGGALPVALSPLPAFSPEHDLGGVERTLVFTREGRSFADLSGARRTRFANDLAASIRRRALSSNGYREL
ncbi:TIR domain-containing protein [Saccharothrix xinjiangensis]|uniref:TIR domain-containing protein n=1 Tax=Saccharothrix xinjiangensis TaxID=204798 RepID=A0ABV9XRM4_9PSEU